jgi:glycosyltransferase involved in cell wall biosynthesis
LAPACANRHELPAVAAANCITMTATGLPANTMTPPLPLLSLIVATVDRAADVATLFASLEAQRCRHFEVVLVDQNADDRLALLVARHAHSFPIVHLKHPRGLSRSRNFGIAHASGEVLAFPDDDCRYDDGTVERITALFAARVDFDGCTGRGVAGPDERAHARFARMPGWVSARGVWTQGISYTMFLRRTLADRVGPFDERLGLGSGTPWAAAEEADYLLRAVATGARIWYDPDLTVRHAGPRSPQGTPAPERGEAYGRAMGFVLRKNRRTVFELAYHLLRPAAGAALAVLRLRTDAARYHVAVARGRWQGWRDGADSAGFAGGAQPSDGTLN